MKTTQKHFDKLINNLELRPVRDLAWALLRPPLFSSLPDCPAHWLQADWLDDDLEAWLLTLDQQPEKLLAHLKNQRATRLGIYFEQLVSFYFEHYPCFELIAKNLQANNTERTIGEYDFIIRDKKNEQHYHIEVAVKFYLGMPALDTKIPNNKPTYNWHSWVGPNKKDTLGIKMNHLTQHQLRLSETDAGKNALRSIGLQNEPLAIRLLVTGRLYYPLQNTEQIQPPYQQNTNFIEKDYWLTATDFNQKPSCLFKPNAIFVVLPRQQWMSKITEKDRIIFSLNTLSDTEILQYIELNQDKQTHIAQGILNEDKEWTEQQRFFVIP